MKKIFLFCVFFSATTSLVSAGNFVYPIDQIAAPSCRFQNWSSLGSDCKMPLPKITNADYDKYKDDKLLRRVYSVLWWATYDYGWDTGMGSHEGVDIATSEGTPVRAIGDGTILIAGSLSGWGKTVTIKHTLGGGKYLYSNYSHLSKILVNKGDTISAGSVVGEVGNTGNSYGNHLHFQLDITDQNHPYYFLNCGKGVNPIALVNQWLCRDFLTANTIDPILFLERGDVAFSAPEAIKKTQELQKQAKKIEQKSIKSREQILDEEVEEFLNMHTISLSRSLLGDNAELKKTYTLQIGVIDKRFGAFRGSLPISGLSFEYDRKALRIFPDQILAIDNGVRDFTITTLKTGSYPVNIKLGKRTITTFMVNVYKPGDMSKPSSASISVKKSLILWEIKPSNIVLKTKYGTNQLDIPYAGKYVLKSLTGKIKFCNVSSHPSSTCQYQDLVEELSFTYDDTYRGALLFNMVAQDFMPIKLVLYRVGEKKPLYETKNPILVDAPLGIDKTYPYFSETINGVKKSLLELNQGYITQDRDITGEQAKRMLRNYLTYLWFAAGNDTPKRAAVKTTKTYLEQQITGWGDYTPVTRIQFAQILSTVMGIQLSTSSDKKWLDEDGPNKNIMTTLRVRYGFSWRDQFGENYFQPDKKITIGEALYLVNTLDSRRDLYALNR